MWLALFVFAVLVGIFARWQWPEDRGRRMAFAATVVVVATIAVVYATSG